MTCFPCPPSPELHLYLLSLTPLVTSCIHNGFLTLLLALNKHERWRGPASVRSLINQMPGSLVQMSAEWSRQQPASIRSAWWGGGGPHKSLHNGSFRKSINGRGERLHNRPCASLITYRVSSLASKVRGQPGFGTAHNPLGCVGVCVRG